MLPGLTTSKIYGALYGDSAVAACIDDAALVAAMIRFEAALALADAETGAIPADDGRALAEALGAIAIAPAALSGGTASAGVPVPALVAALRRELPPGPAHWLHWGATSQDVVDTALVLCLRDALEVMLPHLAAVIDGLAALAGSHAALPMAGRTRGQVATPVTFGLRAARWAQPLIGAEADLPGLGRALLRVQFGGASGANTAVAPHGPAIGAALARGLALQDSPPWHTDRAPWLALAGWAGRVAAALSKMAGDVIVMVRSEVAEISAGTGGGSSTMPQKANPVGAEAIRVLAAQVRHAGAALAEAAAPAEERDGAVWPLEWIALPQLAVALGAALGHAERLVAALVPHPDAMARTLDAAMPGVMAEAVSFALARHMPRDHAQARVKAALASGRPMAEALEDIPEDWAAVLDPASAVPACRAEIARVLATRQRWSGTWT